MGVFDFLRNLFGKKNNQKLKCPNCGAEVTLNMERCPACGVSIVSMFRRKCPECGEINEIGAVKCSKCSYNLAAEKEVKEKEISYTCFVCGYENDAFFAVCPVCGTRTS